MISEKAAYKIFSTLRVTQLGLVGIFWEQQAAVATQLHQDCTKTTDCEFSFSFSVQHKVILKMLQPGNFVLFHHINKQTTTKPD